jgi:hypothetical protein
LINDNPIFTTGRKGPGWKKECAPASAMGRLQVIKT